MGEGVSCIGATALLRITECSSLTAADAGEEEAGLYELLVAGAALTGSTQEFDDSTELARYDVCVADYGTFSFHLDQGERSIEAFFKVPDAVAPTPTATPAPDQAATPVPEDAITPGPDQAATPVPEDAVTPGPEEAATPVPEDAVTPGSEEAATSAAEGTNKPASTSAQTSAADSAPQSLVTPTPTSDPTPTPTVTPTFHLPDETPEPRTASPTPTDESATPAATPQVLSLVRGGGPPPVESGGVPRELLLTLVGAGMTFLGGSLVLLRLDRFRAGP